MAELTQSLVEAWITQTTGKFHYTKVLDGLVDKKSYPKLRAMMHRCKERGIAFPIDSKDGWWRPADTSLEEIYWWDLDGTIGENLILPLGLHEYCYIPMPSLIIITAPYNAGKTALAINVVNLNLEKWANNIFFFVSEGAEMMREKFNQLNLKIPKPPPFKMYRRTENFVDVIQPKGLNVIDYLRVDMEKPYAVGTALFQIFNKLGEHGIAVVTMQKPPGRRLAFGGASTAFEPTLYVCIEKKEGKYELEFEKIKVPKQLEIDPYQLKIQFTIRRGVNLENVHKIIG